MITNNPNCDGTHCEQADGEVRLLPTGGDGNAILCYACYLHEMAYRKDLVKGQMPPDLPAWKSLKVYEGTR